MKAIFCGSLVLTFEVFSHTSLFIRECSQLDVAEVTCAAIGIFAAVWHCSNQIFEQVCGFSANRDTFLPSS